MPGTRFEVGDAIHGDRVAITARRLGRTEVVNYSGRHKIQRLVARDDVYCVIEQPLRARPKERKPS